MFVDLTAHIRRFSDRSLKPSQPHPTASDWSSFKVEPHPFVDSHLMHSVAVPQLDQSEQPNPQKPSDHRQHQKSGQRCLP
jgi:hypothetical protein